MVETFINIFTQYIPPQLTVLAISALPMVGLHGGFLAAALLDVPWQQAIVLTTLGNILPVPFILLFIRKALEIAHRVKFLKRLAGKLEDKALSKAARLAEKYPVYISLGLFLFVVIPLPGSGAWTGSLIAALMRMPLRQSFPAIALGVVTACAIMVVFVYAFPAAIGY